MKKNNLKSLCFSILPILLISLGITACSFFEDTVPPELITPTPSANSAMPLIDNITYTILFVAVIGVIILYLLFREEKKEEISFS